jgi:hypothetical protein
MLPEPLPEIAVSQGFRQKAERYMKRFLLVLWLLLSTTPLGLTQEHAAAAQPIRPSEGVIVLTCSDNRVSLELVFDQNHTDPQHRRFAPGCAGLRR